MNIFLFGMMGHLLYFPLCMFLFAYFNLRFQKEDRAESMTIVNAQQSHQSSVTVKDLEAKKFSRGWSLTAKCRPHLGSEHMVRFCLCPLLCPSTSR